MKFIMIGKEVNIKKAPFRCGCSRWIPVVHDLEMVMPQVGQP